MALPKAGAQLRKDAEMFTEAADDCRFILRQDPKDYHARFLLAHCLLSDAHMAEAESELLVCQKIRPADSRPVLGLAHCAVDRGDLERAQTLLSQALQLNPNVAEIWDAQAWQSYQDDHEDTYAKAQEEVLHGLM